MSKQITKNQRNLFNEVKQLIEDARSAVGRTVNVGMIIMNWNIGRLLNEEILKSERAEYGKGYSKSALTRMCKFHKQFEDMQIVATLSQQLSWSHFIEIITLKTDLEREFYTQMCRIERWNVRTLRKKVQSMLFQRTAISQKPEELAKLEPQALREEDKLTPDLVFQNPCFLDFLGLKSSFQEKDLEQAILNKIEQFLLELGRGFTFVERQKRMIIDGEDFKLDLLFYHRKLKRLIAIDLKIGKFKAEYKGQMELYLRWLEKNEMEAEEGQPIGLILCAEGSYEKIELLQLDDTNVKIAQYITKYFPEYLLKKSCMIL